MKKTSNKQIKNYRQRIKEKIKQVDDDLPGRVTNDTLEANREQVIKKGRKFKYPFYHSKHKTVLISSVVLVVALLFFAGLNLVRLYKYKSYDDLSYSMTKIIPFPVAKVDGSYVDYRDYLFELRATVYSMQRTTGADFSTSDGKRMLLVYQRDALDRAEAYTYARQVAKQHNITVSQQEIDDAVSKIERKSLNIGPNDKIDHATFNRSLMTTYNWTEADFRQSVTNLLYAQKVKPVLDTSATSLAQDILKYLSTNHKNTFSDAIDKFSNDKSNLLDGGDKGFVTEADAGKLGLPDDVVSALFSLQQGKTSGVIKTPDAVYIIKNEKTSGDKRKLAVIKISYKDVTTYLDQLKKQNELQEYISVPQRSVDNFKK